MKKKKSLFTNKSHIFAANIFLPLSKGVSDLVQWVAHVAVTLEEVEDGLSKDLEGEAHVTEVVEAVEHPDTEVLPLGILPWFCVILTWENYT